MGVLNLITSLAGGKKDSGSGALIDPRDGYRSKEQETAVYYFSDENKKGCFAKKDKEKKKGTGCFPKKKNGHGCFKGPGCFPKKHPYVSDAEYDALVQGVISRLDPYHQGLQKLGLDESQVKEIKPISFANAVYFSLWERSQGNAFITESDPFFWKIGDDGVFRSSVYEVTWIYFSGSQMFAYQLTFSTDWEKHSERTFEYHYKDITALSTKTEQTDEMIGEKKIFKTVKNEFTITVPNDEFTVALCNKPDKEEENTIQAMKAMLREKKV
jgi:hypothetical protein